jgi:hypothetical protein
VVRVRTAEEELRARAGEVEPELVRVDDAVRIGVDEEGVLVQVGDRGEGEAEDAEKWNKTVG